MERRADLERIAMAALGETPVPSVQDLCKRLGITVWFMDTYFPAVRSLVAERHRQCAFAETRRRHETLYHDVHGIAAELRSQNFYPSTNRIVEHLPEGSCREWKAVAQAIRQAHKALGIST
jgi:DNA-binding LacI/PurR family transcriptional regulator